MEVTLQFIYVSPCLNRLILRGQISFKFVCRSLCFTHVSIGALTFLMTSRSAFIKVILHLVVIKGYIFVLCNTKCEYKELDED